MLLLPFDFKVNYIPGSRMGIRDYLSRDPIFEPPPGSAEHEGELVIALIRQVNQQRKNINVKQVVELNNSDAQNRRASHTRLAENTRKPPSGRQVDSEEETTRRHSYEKR